MFFRLAQKRWSSPTEPLYLRPLLSLHVPASCNPARSPNIASREARTKQRRDINIVSAMANAMMSGSQGRAGKHHQRAGLVLARLPLLMLLLAVLVGFMHHPVKAENEPGPLGDAEEEELAFVLSSCDDLPDERTEVFGVVIVMGDITCTENRVSNISNVRCFLL